MKNFTYNDMDFSVEKAKNHWDVFYKKSDGQLACVGAALFEGVAESEVEAKARALVKAVFPVGVRSVGPDVAHPTWIGDLKIIGPDISHANFIYWDKERVS